MTRQIELRTRYLRRKRWPAAGEWGFGSVAPIKELRGSLQASVNIDVPLSIALLFHEFKASWILRINYLFFVQECTTVTVIPKLNGVIKICESKTGPELLLSRFGNNYVKNVHFKCLDYSNLFYSAHFAVSV